MGGRPEGKWKEGEGLINWRIRKKASVGGGGGGGSGRLVLKGKVTGQEQPPLVSSAVSPEANEWIESSLLTDRTGSDGAC